MTLVKESKEGFIKEETISNGYKEFLAVRERVGSTPNTVRTFGIYSQGAGWELVDEKVLIGSMRGKKGFWVN